MKEIICLNAPIIVRVYFRPDKPRCVCAAAHYTEMDVATDGHGSYGGVYVEHSPSCPLPAIDYPMDFGEMDLEIDFCECGLTDCEQRGGMDMCVPWRRECAYQKSQEGSAHICAACVE